MRLLVIGEIKTGLAAAVEIAVKEGAKVSYTENITDAISYLRDGKGADLAIIDSGLSIKEFVQKLALEHINIPVVAASANIDPRAAVKAIKDGAKEFIPLPPDNAMIAAIFKALSGEKKPMIASSKAMKSAINIADKVAGSNANILLTGASGTGKEVMAQYIHDKSSRNQMPFVRVNCAAIPDNLLESELFGHEKGAFTGAIARRIGKFEESDGGTLLLDEISEMDIRLQAKLLRAIQEKEIDRIGGSSPVKVDLRIIATSNRNLQEEVSKGKFREDLYFRLNIINIELPRLTERLEDLDDLANFFIDKYCKSNKIISKKLNSAALEAMKKYSWPGNIRELENAMHRAVLLAGSDIIEVDDLLLKDKHDMVSEKGLIANTLNYCLGDANNAANILGISINTLKSKLEKYEIEQ